MFSKSGEAEKPNWSVFDSDSKSLASFKKQSSQKRQSLKSECRLWINSKRFNWSFEGMHKKKISKARKKEKKRFEKKKSKKKNFKTRKKTTENFHFLRKFSMRELRFSICQLNDEKIKIFFFLNDFVFSKASEVGLFCWTKCRFGSFHNSQKCWEYFTGQNAKVKDWCYQMMKNIFYVKISGVLWLL